MVAIWLIDGQYMFNTLWIWVYYNDLTVLPSPGNHGFHREIIPFYGRTIG